ncbi:MAG TPA: RES family NAD+ phosphorylase [Candidatus Angelobacter sp.]|nr:RES family NAD+ phosphorylase [Candidatus Angelobacter sp.]
MSRIYRVLRKAYARTPFDGEGAYRYGGRWSSPGVRLSYASEHQSLAMLEYFVHLDQDNPPPDLVLAVAEVPNDLTREMVTAGSLPANWRDPAAPPELARFGDEFVQRGEHCLLLAPSVLAPNENNCLINPGHGDYKRISVSNVGPLSYDPRMFRKERSYRRH